MIRYPKPLRPGDVIAVAAPSSGVSLVRHLARLELAIGALRERGFKVVEGECVRREHKNASAPASERARELTDFLLAPEIAAVVPPWGGELAIELLGLIDFTRLSKSEPKWVLGYSDTSTLLMPLTLVSGWATAHGTNLFDQVPDQKDPLSRGAIEALTTPPGGTIVQRSSERYQSAWPDLAKHPGAPFNMTERTVWRVLGSADAPIVMRGRVIGGCIDTVRHLAGSRFGDLPAFVRQNGETGTILYLENAEQPPCALARTVWGLRLSGWFEGLAGLVLGRSSGPDAKESTELSYLDALNSALTGIECPVLFDADIGHRPPQLTLVNGALAEIEYANGAAKVTQTLK